MPKKSRAVKLDKFRNMLSEWYDKVGNMVEWYVTNEVIRYDNLFVWCGGQGPHRI